MNYDTLINGEYKLLLEPIAYYTFQGVMIATTATEAAMYDEKLSGGLRSKMVSLSHKNLPLAMFFRGRRFRISCMEWQYINSSFKLRY